MGQLLKMIQKCVSNGWNWSGSSSNPLYHLDNSGSTHANPSDQTITRWSSPNAIEHLPLDLFIKILELLEPKEAARLASVCKWLNEIVSDDKLWEYFLRNKNSHWHSTLFAETNLRYGLPLRTFPPQELSFKHIYGEREEVPRAIIIDGGAGFVKIGWSDYDSPSVRLTTSMDFAYTEAPMETRVHDYFATIFTRMQVCPSMQPVVISSTPFILYGGFISRPISSDVLCSILFKMGVPAFCMVNQETLAMFSARRASGILVNIGFSKTKVFPIINGAILGVESVDVGGLDLTRYLWKQLRQRNLRFSSLSAIPLLKEKLCYVAVNYEAELLKNTEASYRVDSSRCYTLKQERFRTGELLFQPQIGGINERGLHQAVAECIDRCREVKFKNGNDWFKTIVLAGGTARLPGLAQRLEKELRGLLPPSVSNGIRVIASPYGEDAAWHGAKLVSTLSTFTDSWCIKPPPKPKLERTPESTMIFIFLFMVSCIIDSVKRKRIL